MSFLTPLFLFGALAFCGRTAKCVAVRIQRRPMLFGAPACCGRAVTLGAALHACLTARYRSVECRS